MKTMVPTPPADLRSCDVQLATGPAAAAEARRQVRAAICAWDAPVDPDTAVLLTSELVSNAIRHEKGPTITLVISCSRGQLRVDVHDTSHCWPTVADAPADAETGRGLMLVATLAAEWGVYRTPAGKAVYFTLASRPDLASRPADAARREFTRGDGESSIPRLLTVPAEHAPTHHQGVTCEPPSETRVQALTG
jgi:anti-sigma regulatory factor (Ser/Thr protein kinase)